MNKKPTIGAYRFRYSIRVTNSQGEKVPVADCMEYKDDIQKALDDFVLGNDLLPYIQPIHDDRHEQAYKQYLRTGSYEAYGQYDTDKLNSVKISFGSDRYGLLCATVLAQCNEEVSGFDVMSDISRVFREEYGDEFSKLQIPTKDGDILQVTLDTPTSPDMTQWNDPMFGHKAPMWRKEMKKWEEENNKTSVEKAVDRLEIVVDRFEKAVKQLSEIDNKKTAVDVADLSLHFEDAINQLSAEAKSSQLEQ